MQMSFTHQMQRSRRWIPLATTLWVVTLLVSSVGIRARATPMQSTSFERKVLAPSLPEAPFDLRFFSGAVKTNSRGEIITGPDSDPVKKLVGAEAAVSRAGMDRFTKDSLRRSKVVSLETAGIVGALPTMPAIHS